VLSRKLQNALRECLDTRGKALIFINRRGFASFINCRSCGFTLECPRCSVALVYHADTGQASCHYCGHTENIPERCPSCDSGRFKYFGAGTQKVESELRKIFGDAQIFRLDSDTAGGRGAHGQILEKFLAADKAVLLGTQMIAQGHDFPEVTLVGIIAADTMLNLPDFRAAERTFQLLAQAAGRAGRGDRPGQVIVQTYQPEHYAIQAAAAHDYRRFYKQELDQRRELSYPPFSRLTSIVFSARAEADARRLAEQCAEKHAAALAGVAPCILRKLRGFYRWQALLKNADVDYADFPADSPVKIEIDVDPLNMY
jgi:primosomal protein N' (replication factor Y)